MATRTTHQHAKGHDEPWNHDNPRDTDGKPHQHLTAAQKAAAKRHAEAAGRPYPNLVDNMHEAAKAHAKHKDGKAAGRSKSSRSSNK